MTPETVCPTCNSVLRYARAARPGWVCPDSWHESGRISAQGAELNLADSPPLEPPTPPSAGEGELDKLPGRLRLSMANLEIAVKDAGDVVRAREVLAAAINAYIARRVLEVIGEDEDDRPEITEWIVHSKEATKARNELRAEQRQRIAVIKKESQQ